MLRRFHTIPVLRSAHSDHVKVNVTKLQSKSKSGKKLSFITAHDYITGQWANSSNVDAVLIGDSLAMTSLGYKSTTQVPLEEFLTLAKAVSRAVTSKYLVCDVPFGTFEASHEQAVLTCTKILKSCENVDAVKIEGGSEHVPLFQKLTSVGIPVVGHVGLTPQRHAQLGGYKVQAKQGFEDALNFTKTCLELQNDAGIVALVMECVPEKLARFVTSKLDIPTIGIGAGSGCSGQILVVADMLGMGLNGKVPKFVKKYSNLGQMSLEGLNKYVADVEATEFPKTEHSFKAFEDEKYQEVLSRVESHLQL